MSNIDIRGGQLYVDDLMLVDITSDKKPTDKWMVGLWGMWTDLNASRNAHIQPCPMNRHGCAVYWSLVVKEGLRIAGRT